MRGPACAPCGSSRAQVPRADKDHHNEQNRMAWAARDRPGHRGLSSAPCQTSLKSVAQRKLGVVVRFDKCLTYAQPRPPTSARASRRRWALVTRAGREAGEGRVRPSRDLPPSRGTHRVAKLGVQPVAELGDARGDLVEVDGLLPPVALDDVHPGPRDRQLHLSTGPNARKAVPRARMSRAGSRKKTSGRTDSVLDLPL